MKPITCFIFDLDGTLAFTEHANFKAYEETFKQLGMEMTAEAHQRYFGLNVGDMLERHTKAHGIQNSPELLANVKKTKAAIYAKSMHYVEPNHAMIALLRALAPHYHIALATTANEQNARAVLSHFDILDCFDFMVFGGDVSKGKPDPECHHLIAKHFNVEPEECMIFEDSAVGLQAAKAFGGHVSKVVR